MNIEDLILSIIGGLSTIVLALVSVIMMDIKKNLQRLWQVVGEINVTLLRDYATNPSLDEIKAREELHYEQLRKRLHDLHQEVLSPLLMKVQHIQDTVERMGK